MLVTTAYPNEQVKETRPYGSATHFVSVVYNRQHFAVLYYDINGRTVTVFDGLDQKISKWQDHIIHTVKTYGLKPLFCSATCNFRENIYVDVDVDDCATKRRPRERKDMTLDISFDDSKEESWLVKNEHSYVQGDGVSCGPIACLKLMEIYGFIKGGSIETIGEPARGYRNVVMDYYNDCVRRFDSDLKVEARKKTSVHGKQPQRGEETLEAPTVRVAHEAAMLSVSSPTERVSRVTAVEGTGLNFAPKCNNFCFTSRTVCDHIKNNVPINNLGDYVLFPSKCFHQGYFNSNVDMVFVTAQLFARPTISIASDQLTRSHTKKLDFIRNNLNNETVTALSNDILQNWNTTYSLERFGPCKNFDGPVDKASNRQIPSTKFHEAPLLMRLVDTVTDMLQYLTIDMVWIIVKSKPGSGFQSWHQDFNLNKKITKTIAINLGAVKRSCLVAHCAKSSSVRTRERKCHCWWTNVWLHQ